MSLAADDIVHTLREHAHYLLGLADHLAGDSDELRRWYLARIPASFGREPPSVRDDYLDAIAAGFRVTFDTIRRVRAELAPPCWKRPGRPRGPKKG